MMKHVVIFVGVVALSFLLSSAAFAIGGGPTVRDVEADTKVIHRENDIFEEDDFQTVISATVLPAKGQAPIDPGRIKVYLQGALVEGGMRSYDRASGRFLFTLTSQEAMKVMRTAIQEGKIGQGKAPEPMVRIAVTDAGGLEGVGVFNARTEGVSMESHLSVGYTDSFGRFVERGEEPPSPPKRTAGRLYNLVGAQRTPQSPLDLRLVKRFPVQPPIDAGGNASVTLTPAPGGTVDFTFVGESQSYLITIAADSGKVVNSQALVAAPKGAVRQARRLADRIDLLSWRAAGRGVVESPATHQRVVLNAEPLFFGRGGGALDFLADARQIVYVAQDISPVVKACDWAGNTKWQVDDTVLLPNTEIEDRDNDVSLAPTPDGSILVFQSGTDRVQTDNPQFVALSLLSGAHGSVQNSRLMYLPVVAGETLSINGGAGLRLAGHDLVVLNLDRTVGEKYEEETLVLDLDRDDWAPIARLTSPGEGRFAVYGAAVVGDRLVVGCGTGGAALLSVGPTK
ncbi:MAG: hypothetical protein JWM80_5308 [Cyanobacteria bacterium RYN_339]|nr:hypothetical protein [Cyanobacteria bacterium RYN_339]